MLLEEQPELLLLQELVAELEEDADEVLEEEQQEEEQQEVEQQEVLLGESQTGD